MAKKNLTYQSAMEELEGILEQMEENTVEIDQLSTQVKRASELISFCKNKLRSTESDVQSIIDQMNE
jgi:exodeoxyribonuclease VII small subunit